MLELRNDTALAAGLYPGWDRGRRHQLTLVFKAAWRFRVDGTLVPVQPAPPVVEADAHHGAAHETSLSAADETVPFKQGSEVYLYGTAHPASPGAVLAEVAMEIDFPSGERFRKALYVFGPRQWRRGALGWRIEAKGPLEPTPLRYEYAFGGRIPGRPGQEFGPNPVGLGYNPSEWRLASRELPRIEWPRRLVARPGHKPPPAGFGPLPRFWQPRADEAGEAAADPEARGGCPWGEAAEPTLHHAAPPDQRFGVPFGGGETLRLAGFACGRGPVRPVTITLPRLAPGVTILAGGAGSGPVPVVDTLVIDTDAMELHLVGRAGIPWRRRDPRRGWVILEDAESGGARDAGSQTPAGGPG